MNVLPVPNHYTNICRTHNIHPSYNNGLIPTSSPSLGVICAHLSRNAYPAMTHSLWIRLWKPI